MDFLDFNDFSDSESSEEYYLSDDEQFCNILYDGDNSIFEENEKAILDILKLKNVKSFDHLRKKSFNAKEACELFSLEYSFAFGLYMTLEQIITLIEESYKDNK